MKKMLLAILAVATLATGVFADGFDSGSGEFFIGAGSVKSDGNTTTDGVIGWGATKYWENGVLAGASIYGGGSGSDEFFLGADLRIGYSYNNFGIYGIGSCMTQTLDGKGMNSTGGNTAYGFGGGAGIEYKFSKWTVAAESKTYSMQSTLPDYTMTTNMVLVKYRFK